MSDEIKVTIVTECNEKLNNRVDEEQGGFKRQPVIVTHHSSATLMSTLLKAGLVSGSFCGGRGSCGRCKVQYIKGVTMPTALERSMLEPEELRQGYRLACLSRPKGDCVIRLALEEEKVVSIVTETIGLSENNDQNSQQKECSANRKPHVIELNSGECRQEDCAQRFYVVGVDLGTTTIAMELYDIETGAATDTYCEMNPQRSYGADVLSRIQASCEGHGEVMQRIVWEVLKRGLLQFAKTLEERHSGAYLPDTGGNKEIITSVSKQIKCMCIAGNTAMEQLLLGCDMASLGVSPFTPAIGGLREIRCPAWDMPVYVAPVVSAFVGGDIVAGLYALDMLGGDLGNARPALRDDPPEETGGVRMLIDLGTNGEMAITDGSRMLVTATAAGPAFEGGAGAQIIGTDMIAVTAAMLEKGVLDETGLLAEPYFETGVMMPWKQDALLIRPQDIRNLQLAKAAVRAGAEILWDALGAPAVDRVYLAGGFGYYLDTEAAFQIGLLPARLRGRVQAVGNASLAGACRLARAFACGTADGRALEERIASIDSINLARQEGFEDLYLRSMNLCPEG